MLQIVSKETGEVVENVNDVCLFVDINEFGLFINGVCNKTFKYVLHPWYKDYCIK